jgi:hypothetical protein
MAANIGAATADVVDPADEEQVDGCPSGSHIDAINATPDDEGVECTPHDLENYGSGDGVQFQKLAKACPAVAVEFAAVGLRNIRKHWGPINQRAAEVRSECDVMLQKVEEEVDKLPGAVVALLV